jgi:uncharacterized protein
VNGTRAQLDASGITRPLHAAKLFAYPAIGLVHLYRLFLSPLFGGSCKYYPSCSQYALDALRQYGLFRGVVLAGWRLLRCNPWSHGGVDHAHDQRVFR